MTLREAKKIFFEYDGSRFYMSRDGVETAYVNAGVPPKTEAAWLEKLTQQKLAALQLKGNWAAIHFLAHHGDYGHLAQIVAVEPKGLLWERCTFLEEMLAYVRGCIGYVDGLLVGQAIDRVIEEASRLMLKARSQASQSRIEQIARDSESARESLRLHYE
jgi:hypothetical protein